MEYRDEADVVWDVEEWADILACAAERGTSVQSLIRQAVLDDLAR